jgi:YqjK-like protein
MRNKLTNLAKRREHLVAQAAGQRLLLAQSVEAWRAPLALADRGLAVVSYIKIHPAWMVGTSVALLTVARPSRVGKWFQRGWVAWQVVRRLRGKTI